MVTQVTRVQRGAGGHHVTRWREWACDVAMVCALARSGSATCEFVTTQPAPGGLVRAIGRWSLNALAKLAIADGKWSRAERELETALKLSPGPLCQRRLERIRRRSAPIDDANWQVLHQQVDAAKRLPPDWLASQHCIVWRLSLSRRARAGVLRTKPSEGLIASSEVSCEDPSRLARRPRARCFSGDAKSCAVTSGRFQPRRVCPD